MKRSGPFSVAIKQGKIATHQSAMSLKLSTFQRWEKGNKYLTIDSTKLIQS